MLCLYSTWYKIIWICLMVAMTTIVGSAQKFVHCQGSNFVSEGHDYYYIGANYWQGPLLASEGQHGDRKRLIRELKALRKRGIKNLRILAGAEGPDHLPYRVTPTLQVAPGVYNDTLLQGLDFLLAKMGSLDMKAIIYLQNSWDWSGGIAQYLQWNGYGDIQYMQNHTWEEYQAYNTKFYRSIPSQQQFEAHVKYMLSRTNTITGVAYIDDPTIMAWEIANEPRAFSEANIPAFKRWISQTAALIKSIDKNHLVTTGSEGRIGCMNSLELFEEIHSDKNIDYLTMHIWPKTWGWYDPKKLKEGWESAMVKTVKYIDEHIEVAKSLSKPIVLEEFGIARDSFGFDKKESTNMRDKYYQMCLQIQMDQVINRGALGGTNFWAYSGFAAQMNQDPFWQEGEAIAGDPPQEEQGLYGIYEGDSTLKVVSKYNKQLRKILRKRRK
ncbi:MAG: beta-mannosidase [Saprospiraceae bacterium]